MIVPSDNAFSSDLIGICQEIVGALSLCVDCGKVRSRRRECCSSIMQHHQYQAARIAVFNGCADENDRATVYDFMSAVNTTMLER
jgi:hypothetical protein